MRAAVRPFLLLLLVLVLVPAAAMADSLDAARPSSFFQFSTEENVLLFGNGLAGNVGTNVTFSGPGGTYTTEPQNGSTDMLDVALPEEILRVAGRYAVTVQAVDDNGVRNIGPTFIDVVARPVEEAPLLDVPEGVRAEATDNEGAVVRYDVSATTFAGQPLTPTCSQPSGSRFSMGTTSVTCSATDQFGTTTRGFFVAVSDTTRPVLTLPTEIRTESRVVQYSATATDNIDGQVTATCFPASGSTFEFGSTTVQCSAIDASLNRVDDSFRVFVTGGTPPSLILPNDFTVEATGDTGAIVNYAVSTDADATVDCTPGSGMLFPVGKITVECESHGPTGSNFGAFFVTVADTTPPALELPDDIQIDSNQPYVVLYSARAIDLVDGSELIACTPPSGSTFQRGTTTVTCEATDSHGNKATGSFIVKVGKNEPPPTLILPNDFTVEATSSAGAAVTYSATSDGSVACSPASGATFPIAVTTVQCTATGPGGTTSGSFKVTVADRTAPVITTPGTLTAEATSSAGAVVTYTATATDVVDGNVAVNCAPPAGSTFPLGTTAVQCTAADTRGNTRSASFTVIVQDTTNPVISKIVASPATLWPPDHTMRGVTLTVTANDAVSGVVSRITGVTSNQAVVGPGSGNTIVDWQITGALTVDLRAERTQGNDRIYTIAVESVDGAGNRSVGTVQVTVVNSKPRAVR
jgi:hypothetical protein